MVAKAGKGWKLAPSLIKLWEEVNAIAPGRSRISDGSIGDAAHAKRASYHNPDSGWVHALDITHDPKNGMDIHALARVIAERRDHRIHDIISNGQRWTHEKGWVKYNGPNKHTSHAHFGVKKTKAAREDTSSFFKTEEKKSAEAIDTQQADEEQMMMKLFRDFHGHIWLWYPDGKRVHLADPNEVRVWKDYYKLPMIDLGPGSIYRNEIVSAVWLKRIKQVAG